MTRLDSNQKDDYKTQWKYTGDFYLSGFQRMLLIKFLFPSVPAV